MFPSGCTNGEGAEEFSDLVIFEKMDKTQELIDAKVRGETHLVIGFHFFFKTLLKPLQAFKPINTRMTKNSKCLVFYVS